MPKSNSINSAWFWHSGQISSESEHRDDKQTLSWDDNHRTAAWRPGLLKQQSSMSEFFLFAHTDPPMRFLDRSDGQFLDPPARWLIHAELVVFPVSQPKHGKNLWHYDRLIWRCDHREGKISCRLISALYDACLLVVTGYFLRRILEQAKRH